MLKLPRSQLEFRGISNNLQLHMCVRWVPDVLREVGKVVTTSQKSETEWNFLASSPEGTRRNLEARRLSSTRYRRLDS